MADEKLSAFFNPLVTDFLRTPNRCCKGGLGNCVFMIVVWYTTLLKCYKQMVHDLLPLCKAKKLGEHSSCSQWNWKIFEFLLTRAVRYGKLGKPLNILFATQNILATRIYIRGIGIVTCSACAFQKNQVLFQENTGSPNSTRLFSLKQLYWCRLSWIHLQIFLVFI